MAFLSIIAGDTANVAQWTVTYQPKSGYTPVRGDLVILDSTIAVGVDLIAANENPMGIVLKHENGITTVWKFRTGDRVVLPYSGSVAKGDKVEGDGGAHQATIDRSTVRTDNSNGVGFVVAVDTETAPGVGFCVVEF